MITATFDAARAVAKLAATRDRLRAHVRGAVDEDAARLLAIVQKKLSGEVLNARSGALFSSIRAETLEDAVGIGARVFSDGSVPCARIQEYGGRISIPEVVPKNAKALAFPFGGRLNFARSAAAHMIDIPERSYMRASLAEFAASFTDGIRRVVTDAFA